NGGAANGGANGGAANGGAPGSSGDPCDDCVFAKCGAQISACNASPDCVAMGKCYDACVDDACFDTCYDSHPAGQALDDAIFDCVFTGCASECQF
ncbi:MAG TPA: hypothetical protein PKD61_20510, partial [Polyangiaceae bacterium]|nr:hypothetical protein [Polyangiaceae bacterium]